MQGSSVAAEGEHERDIRPSGIASKAALVPDYICQLRRGLDGIRPLALEVGLSIQQEIQSRLAEAALRGRHTPLVRYFVHAGYESITKRYSR